MKAEKQKDSGLYIAKTLYEEANERLTQAIKDKNFNEAAIAQGLLEVEAKSWNMQWSKPKSVQTRALQKQKETP